MNEMTSVGLRVLGVAFREMQYFDEDMTRDEVDEDMVFVGMLGIEDPPRKEAKEAVHLCKEAGIIVRMVTGDHPATAAAIAQQVRTS